VLAFGWDCAPETGAESFGHMSSLVLG
jgi:hypothetical protein